MIEVTDCALVDKAVVQRLREEAKSDRESGYTSRVMRGLTTTAVLRELDLWEDDIKEPAKKEAENGMDYGMEHVIERIKVYCREEKFSKYGQAVAVARGTLDTIEYLEPDRVYTVAEVCKLLEALHDIVYADVKQKEMP